MDAALDAIQFALLALREGQFALLALTPHLSKQQFLKHLAKVCKKSATRISFIGPGFYKNGLSSEFLHQNERFAHRRLMAC